MSEQPITNSPIVPPADPSATPMIQQYIEIKSVNADSLLFYRMGDFYELFFGDAEIAARALNITLTKRGKHAGVDIPMCGVPVHAADDYLQKLIAQGFKVAVCEQTEDPAQAKKRGSKAVVRRDVVRLVTPGTITEEAILDPREHVWMATIARLKGADGLGDLAIARIDLSTGSFDVFQTNPGRLVSDVLGFEPRELVLSDTLFQDEDFALMREQIEHSDCMLTPEHKSIFDSASAERRLAEFFGVGTMEGIGNFSRAELAAASAALSYVLKTQVNARPILEVPRKLSDGGVLGLDSATRTNLELAKTLSGERKGSLLHAIDRTMTAAGGRLLADHLRAPLCDVPVIDARLDAASFLLSENTLRTSLRQRLAKTADMARALSRLALERGGPRDLAAIATAFHHAKDLCEFLPSNISNPTNELPLLVQEALSHLEALPSQLAFELSIALGDDLPLLARDGGFVKQGYRMELDELRQLRDESRQIIAQLQAQYAEQTGVKNLKIKYNNVLGYFIEVTALNAEALTGSDEAKAIYIHRQTLANAMRFTTTELADLESKIASAAGRAIQIEQEIFHTLVEQVKTHDSAIRAASNALAVLDVLASHAELAQSEGYCRPMVDNSMQFKITAGRHPIVEQALRAQAGHPFVANDCDLSGEQAGGGSDLGQIWLLTGPNMGGKSTLLRQNALIAIMAQMGCFVPAGAAHIGVFDRIFSRVGAADDLARGRSTFMVEMVETAAILNQATQKSFVILDEIGRGTATYDGLSIAWASLEALHETNCARAIFATHYHELTALADSYERLHNVTMAVKEFEGEVIFLHEVRAGSADRSYGIQVAQLAGLPKAVITRARTVLGELEQSQTQNGNDALIDELPLFSASIAQAQQVVQTNDELRFTLDELNPDEMSPREALQAIYDLKSLL